MRNKMALIHGSLGLAAMSAAMAHNDDNGAGLPDRLVAEFDVGQTIVAQLTFTPEGLPDRLCVDPTSPFYNRDQLRKIGVKFNGEVCPNNVQEYCVSEGWVVFQERRKDEGGKLLRGWNLTKKEGKVEAFARHNPSQIEKTSADAEKLRAAELKRQRKAAKLKGFA